ncbi:MAG TPA: DUF1553 domain-containing protein, partial [Planctomycetes bacterium]|nr:DUF1553 domain-containing protein [Planctomycetota bacterium]
PLILLLSVTVIAADKPAVDQAARLEFFEKKIRPVLVLNCYECHSVLSKEPKGELLLDSRERMRRGGESGPAVVPGNLEKSLILSALKHESLEMPPKKKLPAAVVSDFVTWIKDGAVDPRDQPSSPEALSRELWEATFQQRLNWWSLQPVRDFAVPKTTRGGWTGKTIDPFVLSKLSEAGLGPTTRADKQTLVRRLSYALTGLPPRPQQVQAFVQDESANAWEKLVEHYLASAHFGERWARHWMDVVRYTDTYGYEWDVTAKGSWRYRDYLIRAFNTDVGFDQLAREQIAGDLLSRPRINHEQQLNESLIGVMFYQLGEKRHGDSSSFEGIHQEMLDNKIDAFSKAFQALTISCARCHDHKLDPVSQKEYYALAGAFMSSRWVANAVDLPARNRALKEQLLETKGQLRQALAKLWREDLEKNIQVATLDKIQPPQPLPMEDINYVWQQVYRLEDGEVAEKWKNLANTIQQQSKERSEKNNKNLTVLADFSQGHVEGWNVDGDGVAEPIAAGDFQVLPTGDQVLQVLHLGGYLTASLSSKSTGALRSPLLNTIEQPAISVLASGGNYAAYRRVIDNAFLCEKQTYLEKARYQWLPFTTYKDMPQRRIYVEFVTKGSNPNFPPRWGLGAKLSKQAMADPRSWFAVSKVVAHQAGVAPADELQRFLPLFVEEAPATKEQAAARYRQWLLAAVNRWAEGSAQADDIILLNNLLLTPWITKAAKHPALETLVTRYREVEAQVQPARTVNGMADLDEGVDYRFHHRGSYYQLGDPVRRGYLRMLTSGAERTDTFATAQSGRLKLAERILDPENPLTARVYVNRVWHWLFGQGLVDTPNNFGQLGGRPSHPELLDWLTKRFVEDGWSTKKLIRRIVLSQTWQQSGRVKSQASQVDPRNRLLHHFPTRRLEAEAIRDGMLAVSGRLDATLYGPPTDPYRTAEDETKRLFTGPLDGNGRRSIYTKVTIMEPPKFLLTFNQPKPKIPTGRRDVTSTPIQALTLLNDPFVLQQSRVWGKRLATARGGDVRQRIRDVFQAAFARGPSNTELARWEQAVHDLARLHEVSDGKLLSSEKVWADVAHAIFNTKEFIYVK